MRTGRRGKRRTSASDQASALTIAKAIADGDVLSWSDQGKSGVLSGLKIIAGLSERLGALAEGRDLPARQPALFQWCHLDVLEKIGEGASSEVYRAWDPLLAIEVALKLSHPGIGRHSAREWIEEARRAARLRHPNVVSVHGVDQQDGRAGIWLDLIDGESLQAWGQRVGPLGLRDWCLVGIDMARGLGAIHRSGIVHCDLKPANLLRDRDGRVLIADFGAAASSSARPVTGCQRGTPLTMAPEVLQGGASTTASDMYGLGVVMYWLATGKLPVQAQTLDELLAEHARPRDLPMPGNWPPATRSVLQRLLAGDPRRRPATAAEVEDVLAQTLQPAITDNLIEPRRTLRAPVTEFTGFGRLVGREAEQAYLRQEYARACHGHSLPVLVAGETGTGKTALLSRFGQWVQAQGGRFAQISLAGEAVSARLAPALLWAMTHGDPETAAALPAGIDGSDPAAVARAWMAKSSGQPLVLALDDVQGLDEGDRQHLIRLVAGAPPRLLLIGALRNTPAQKDAGNRLFGDGPIGILPLRPFAAEQAEGVIAELLGAPEYEHDLSVARCEELHRLSGGNPFYLSELLRHLIASGQLVVDPQRRCWIGQPAPMSLPASLELLALDRCRHLPDRTRAVIDVAAVLGERFPRAWLEAVWGDSEQPSPELAQVLAPALAAGVLEWVDSQQLAFRHGLIRHAWYAAMAETARRDLHRACARRLTLGASAGERLVLSRHAEHAGDIAAAFAAGYQALTAPGDSDQADLPALERLSQLLARGADADVGQRWRIALARVQALRQRGRLPEAQAAIDTLGTAFRVPVGGQRDRQLRLERAHIAFALGEHREVVADLASTVDAANDESSMPVRWRRETRLLSIRALAALGEYRRAEILLQSALQEPRVARDEQIALRTLHGWCMALQGRMADAERMLDSALRLTGESDLAVRADLLRRLNWVSLERGRYQQAYRHGQAAHAAYRRIADAMGQAKCRLALADVRLAQGLHDEAMGFLNRVIPELDQVGDRHCQAEGLWCLAQAQRLLGDHAAAQYSLDQALTVIAEVGDRDDEFRFLTEYARLHRDRGDAGAAMSCARQALAIATELASDTGVAYAQIEVAAAQLASGETAQATALCRQAGSVLRAIGAGEIWRADWLLGRCLLAQDDVTAAVQALAAAQGRVQQIIDDLPRTDSARRERLRVTWQPLVDEHAQAVRADAGDDAATQLLRRWSGIGQSHG